MEKETTFGKMNSVNGQGHHARENGSPGERARAPGSGGISEIRWSDLPRTLQYALERTPRGQWYRIRPMLVQCPETNQILDIAKLVDQIIPRSTLGVRRRMASKEERVRKVQELIDNMEAFWSAVEGLQTTLERVARSAGIWTFIDQKRGREGTRKGVNRPTSTLSPTDPGASRVQAAT